MANWKTYKGQSPWEVEPITDKVIYNEGDRISSISNPVWDVNHEFSGIPVTDKHAPCGYWSKDYVPVPTPSGKFVWQQQDNCPFTARSNAVAASTGELIYLGLGSGSGTYLKDWWEYNSTTGIWTQKPIFPGEARYGALAVACGTKIYVGFGGSALHSSLGDWWEYNILTEIWTQKTGTGSKNSPIGAAYGTKIYVGTGVAHQTDQWWEYDTETDTWTQKGDFAGGTSYGRGAAVCVRFGDYIYAGLGVTYYEHYRKDWWRYNPSNDTWLQKADCLIDHGLAQSVAVVLGEKILIGTGMIGNYDEHDFKDWMRSYNPDTNEWAIEDAFLGGPRHGAVAGSVSSMAFIGTGRYTSNYKDWWKFSR